MLVRCSSCGSAYACECAHKSYACRFDKGGKNAGGDHPHRKKETSGLDTGAWIPLLKWGFFIALLASFAVTFVFIVSANRRLEEAIELAKPQEGTLTLIAPADCPQCASLSARVTSVKVQNVTVTAEREVSAGSSDGVAAVTKFSIQRLPALVFESDEEIKAPVRRAMEQSGGRGVEKTAVVWEQDKAPYVDARTGEVMGLVRATYIEDGRCDECFDLAQILKPFLTRFGVYVTEEETVDVSTSTAKELISTYAITAVPTVVLSKEAAVYAPLVASWRRLGSIEGDGSFVFRTMDAVRGTYRDLESGEIVAPPEPGQEG